MYKIKQIILSTLLLFSPSIVFANTSTNSYEKNTLAVFYTLEGDIQKKFNTLVETKLKTIGFNITDPHKRVNDQYKKKYGSTILDVLSFMSVVNDENILPLLNIDPRIATFSPFNMLIYKKLDEKNTHVGHLVPEAMLDIVGIDDPKVRAEFISAFKPLDTILEKELKANGAKVNTSYLPYKKLPKRKMINFEFEFEAPEDMEDFIDEFQNDFELAFIDKQYLIAGYHNFLDATDDAEEILSDYEAFWTYSLCHLEYSYNMFDNKDAHPEAGLFAPCSMYMYIKKGSNKLVMGMPTLVNWSDSLGIIDKKRVGLVQKLDREIPEILTAFGMKKMPNVNPLTIIKKAIISTPKVQEIKTNGKIINIIIPKVPKVPTPIQINTINGSNIDASRSIKFSKRVPPNYVPSRLRVKKAPAHTTNTNIGEINKGKIAAFLRGKFMDIKTAKSTLIKAGFTIVGVTPVNKKGDLISIVFTDKNLEKMAAKKNRGFAASLRLLINTKDRHISITNPLYIAKAFMQKDFDEKVPKEVLAKITTNFIGLLNSKDTLKFQLLPKYQFMNGMPHYEDMTIVARGSNLLSKIKNNKKVLFVQNLENGSTLIGVKLGKRTEKFTSRIGTNNAGLLPYPILIENGEAKILEPKYYISVMYPLLQMSEFMTIATVPGAVIKDCEKVFK